MPISPIFEGQASVEVKQCYEKIRRALELSSIPLFFAYFGSFPEYLEFITDPLSNNLRDKKFIGLVDEAAKRLSSLINETLLYSKETEDWLKTYNQSPSYYNFRKNLSSIFTTNLKIAFVFIALREALKGWAVAAKQLPRSNQNSYEDNFYGKPESFIYDDIEDEFIKDTDFPPTEIKTNDSEKALIKKEVSSLDINLMPVFFRLARQDFSDSLKKEEFWILRVGAEKILLSYLSLFPHLISSPINVVLKLTGKYESFPDFLYLLSEHFPTYAVHRMLFSSFMAKA